MASLNKVFLIGNLTRDPELRYVPSGTAVATFTLAVSRVYKTQTGEKKEQASFLRIVVWGRRAEVCGEYLTKGSPLFVEGRLQSRDWETQDGQKRNTVEVVADNIQFLRMGPKGEAGPARKTPPAEDVETINLSEINLNEDVSSNTAKSGAEQGEGPAHNEEVPF